MIRKQPFWLFFSIVSKKAAFGKKTWEDCLLDLISLLMLQAAKTDP